MPEIGSLMEHIEKAYTMNKLKAIEEMIYRQAWGIKKGCGFVKRKGRRGEFTKDSWINLCFFLGSDMPEWKSRSETFMPM